MKWHVPLALVVLLFTGGLLWGGIRGTVGTGAYSAGNDSSNAVRVQESLPERQQRADIYIPLREQFQSGGHPRALEKLVERLTRDPAHVRADCFRCHTYMPQQELLQKTPLEKLPSVLTPISCGNCHRLDERGNYVLTIENITSLCGTCHSGNPTGATFRPGQQVKHPQLEMVQGTGAIGVPPIPSGEFAKGVTCADCHMPNQSHEFLALTPSEARKANRLDSCLFCHYTDPDPQTFSSHIDSLKEENQKQIVALTGALKEWQERVASSDNAQAREIYDRLVTNVTMLEVDGSNGLHNSRYARAIIQKAREDLRELENLLGGQIKQQKG